MRVKPIFRQCLLCKLDGFIYLHGGFVQYGHQRAMYPLDIDGFHQANMALFVNDGFYSLFHGGHYDRHGPLHQLITSNEPA